MLKNVSDRTVELRWDGKSVHLNSGDMCDVTASFGVHDKQILALEDRFMSKFKYMLVKGDFSVVEEKFEAVEEKNEPETVPEPQKMAIGKKVGRPKKR